MSKSHKPRLERKKAKFTPFLEFRMVMGEVLEEYNQIENKINELIVNYYMPAKNAGQFRLIVLNSNVLGMGQKCKILMNMRGFDSKIVEKIRNLSSIRNGIAHFNAIPVINIEPNNENKISSISHKNVIRVMNSSGKVIPKELELQYDEFALLEHDISMYISNFNKGLKV